MDLQYLPVPDASHPGIAAGKSKTLKLKKSSEDLVIYIR
jgi:hypothetical protein